MAISNLLSQFDTIVMVISFIVAIGSLGIGRCAIYERYTDSTNTLILSRLLLDWIVSYLIDHVLIFDHYHYIHKQVIFH